MEPMPKPSLEQMLETIPQQMLDEKVRDIHLEDIARELVDWKSVCTTLGISETEEAAIEEENRTAHLRRFVICSVSFKVAQYPGFLRLTNLEIHAERLFAFLIC